MEASPSLEQRILDARERILNRSPENLNSAHFLGYLKLKAPSDESPSFLEAFAKKLSIVGPRDKLTIKDLESLFDFVVSRVDQLDELTPYQSGRIYDNVGDNAKVITNKLASGIVRREETIKWGKRWMERKIDGAKVIESVENYSNSAWARNFACRMYSEAGDAAYSLSEYLNRNEPRNDKDYFLEKIIEYKKKAANLAIELGNKGYEMLKVAARAAEIRAKSRVKGMASESIRLYELCLEDLGRHAGSDSEKAILTGKISTLRGYEW